MQSKNPNQLPKLNSLIQKLLGEILQPYLSEMPGLTTVSDIEVSKDKRWAKAWLSIVGTESDDSILEHIQKNAYDIQGQLNRALKMKPVPRLQFYLDTSPRYAQHIEELLDQIKKEEQE
ncbi:MAG: 30S ribosome-binding factor RbfA [Candidatus Doudnabacteria bacterium]